MDRGSVILFVFSLLTSFVLSTMVSSLLLIVSSVLFLCFLMRLCKIVGRNDLAKAGRLVFIAGSLVFTVTVTLIAVLSVVSVAPQLGAVPAYLILASWLAVASVFALYVFKVSVSLTASAPQQSA